MRKSNSGLAMQLFPVSISVKHETFSLVPTRTATVGGGGGGGGGGRVVRRCCVSYITGASNWYWLTVGQGLLSL